MKRPKNQDEYVPSSTDLELVEITLQLFGNYALDRLPWFIHAETHEIMRINNIYDNEMWVVSLDATIAECSVMDKGLKNISAKEFLTYIKNNQLFEVDKDSYCNEYFSYYNELLENKELSLPNFYHAFNHIAMKLKVIPKLSYQQDVMDIYQIIKNKLSEQNL